ncbi:tRNA-dihydrouridine(20) synthase [NAD(P)+]-like [Apophysomyces ossiformis]|uniref:tRNA-dihydrouridine synthase n=1 Tax=Apophysomyces ossiformis TaxID=679940 RepID=A0A8H7EQK4_9FUNG|nr:tRNA-dihydrouridine(20) synthase [NAD(P)+]-like [Apophysomyces ossiformis]
MTQINYANQVVLAPMVRVSTLPFRLTALKYGADLVWSEELVDKRIIGSVRKYNDATNAVEYWKGKSLVFSTNAEEKGKVILQLGTADPDLALEAALTVKQDVAGIDVNCGCPKKFSIQGGMGAALLSNPEKLQKILTNLVKNCGLPVTCKIRLLDTPEKTVELVKMIESTGVKALTVHCRTKEQRPTSKANWDALVAVVDAVRSIPVMVNGDVYSQEDISKVKLLTKASSVMIARGALYNPSVFRKEGMLSYDEACVDVDNIFQNTKYVLLSMNTEPSHTRSERYRKMQQAKSTLALCEIFDLGSYYHEVTASRKANLEAKGLQSETGKRDDADMQIGDKRSRQDRDEDDNQGAEKEAKKVKLDSLEEKA